MTSPNRCHDEPAGAASFGRGTRVTVRRLEEILGTLDAEGKLDGLPFMPEMIPLCGRTFRVHRRAERTCVEGVGLRGMRGSVLLEGARCDGSDHQGCQRGCLLFWRNAWLRPADGGAATEAGRPAALAAPQLPTRRDDKFFCQSTELLGATSELETTNLKAYLHDLWTGEVRLPRFVHVLWLALVTRVRRQLRLPTFFDLHGDPQETAPVGELNLQPGELVQVKGLADILPTLDPKGCNRGLTFEPGMTLHCGRRYRVLGQVATIISEKTGKTVKLRNTVILDGVVCEGICVQNCPRANYFYWRECWLERVEA